VDQVSVGTIIQTH